MDELKQPECPHDDWTVLGENTIGRGICSLCGKSFGLDFLLRQWKIRIEREVKEFCEAQRK